MNRRTDFVRTTHRANNGAGYGKEHGSGSHRRCSALACACAIALAWVVPPALAQQAQPQQPQQPPSDTTTPQQGDPTTLDAVQVIGIRGSLARSSDFKRSADSITDAISAEDVGKFPDANIADALQRVTGVQISRVTGGEGQYVSVRGLNSLFNLTTFNGRVLATDNAGRDFSFDVMPSEALNRVTVYKSPTPALQDGSIGGLIELSTYDPLSRPGFHFNGSVSALYDDASSDTTPRFGFVASDTFRDNTVGVFGGIYYYKRKWRSDSFEMRSDSTEPIDINGDGVTDAADGRSAFPGIYSYQVKTGDRERLSWIGGVSWKPNDRITTTVDGFYSRYKTPELNYSYNVNFYSNDGARRLRNVTAVPWNGSGHLLTSFDVDNIPLEIGTDDKERDVDLYQIGWNTKFNATDKWTAALDLAYSVADRPNPGKDAYTVAGVNGGTYHYEARKPLPSSTCLLPDGSNCHSVGNDGLGLHYMLQQGESTRDEAFSSRFDLDFTDYYGSLMASVKGGLFYSNRSKDKQRYASTNGCAYCGFTDKLGPLGVVAAVPFPGGGYQAGSVGGYDRWVALNANALFRAAIASRGQAYFDQNIAAKLELRSSSLVEEEQYGSYLQAALKADTWDATFGVRYVRTDLTSSGHTQTLLSMTQIPGSTNYTGTYSPVAPTSVDYSYDDWLPSANFTYRFKDNLQLRAAASRTIARPTFQQLGVDVFYEISSFPPSLTYNGNPRLDPIRADSFDLSLEWYDESGASASIAAFHKKIEGFVTLGVTTEQVLDRPFRVTRPINGDTAKLTGAELAFQYMFDSGFGGVINYTYIDSTADVTLAGVRKTTTLDGVSRNTINLQAIYEKGPLEARLSYSYRDKFVECSVCGPANTPATVAASGFLDFSGSYALNDKLSLFLQAYNLTGEEKYTYSLDERYTRYYEPYSRRFEVGVRMSF